MSTLAARRAAPRRSRPRRAPARRGPRARIRWDRIGRTSLLVVLAVVAGLYVQHALEYLAARSQADRQRAYVQRLVRENATLRAQQQTLNDPATIRRDARALGMVQAGERPYVVIGLPGH